MLVTGTGIGANAKSSNISYTGGVWSISLFNGFTPVNSTQSGTVSLKFAITSIYSAEQFVNLPTVIANNAPVAFPLSGNTFSSPGAGQGWSVGIWDNILYLTTNGGSLSNIQQINMQLGGIYGANTTGLIRIGINVNDVSTGTQGAGNGTVAKQLGVVIANMANDGATYYPFYGATQNVGLLNSSTTFVPSAPMITNITSGSNNVNISTYTGSGSLNVTSTNGFNTSFTTASYGSSTTISAINTATFLQANNVGWAQAGMGTIVDNTGTSHTFTYTSRAAFVFGGVVVSGSGTINATAAINPVILIASGNNQATSPAISYTGVSGGNTFTGCTTVFGTATIATGQAVFSGSNTQSAGANFTVDARYSSTITLVSASAVAAITGAAVITGVGVGYDGQVITIVNGAVSVTNTLTFTSGVTQQLILNSATRVLAGNGGTLTVIWKQDMQMWVEIGFSQGTGSQTLTSSPTPTSGVAFTPSTICNTTVYLANSVSQNVTVTMGPSSGAENTIYPSTVTTGKGLLTLNVPANWKVIVTVNATMPTALVVNQQ